MSLENTPSGIEHVATGRFEQVLSNIHRKEQLLSEGNLEEANKIRVVVYFQGGGMAVAEEVWFAKRMFERGWFHNGVVDAVIAGSGGALVAAYALTGNNKGMDFFESICEKGGLASVRNVRRGSYVNFNPVEQTLHEIEPDIEGLRKVTSSVFILMRNSITNEREAPDIRHLPLEIIYKILFASCIIPKVGNVKNVIVNGIPYNDGDVGGIAFKIIDNLHPSDVLIIGSGPFERSVSQETISRWAKAIGDRTSDPLLQLTLSSWELGAESYEEMLLRHWYEDLDNPVNWAHIGPKKSALGLFTSNTELIRRRIKESERSSKVLLYGGNELPKELSA